MILNVDNVSKRFGRTVILDGVRLQRAEPGILALLGENGTGKSTLLRIAAGALRADAGGVFIDDRSVADDRHARRKLGYLPESARPFPHLTVAECLALVASLKRASGPNETDIDRLGVRSYLDQRIGTLSLGQRRRAGLLMTLIGSPHFLILDEPTNGLDPEGIELLAQLLREHTARGGISLVATHNTLFVEHAGATHLRLEAGTLIG